MKAIKRKVKFFKFGIEEHKYNSDEQKTVVSKLPMTKVKEIFDTIYFEKMIKISSKKENRAIKVKNSVGEKVVEVIENNVNFAFLKIGQQNHSNTVAIRSEESLKSKKVPLTKNQNLELFTYCLIDFNNGVVSYIGIFGAPNISVLKLLITENANNTETISYFGYINSILSKDIINEISKKSVLSNLKIRYEVPSDSILSECGSSQKFFEDDEKLRYEQCVCIKTKRNKSLFGKKYPLPDFVEKIRSTYGEKLKSLTVSAKNANEHSQVFNLLENEFTREVYLEAEQTDELTENEFKEALIKTYMDNKEFIEYYIRCDD